MSETVERSDAVVEAQKAARLDMKFEVVVIPVSDVGRAADFYGKLGWRVDADIVNGESRILQFTPPGSPASIVFGTGLTPSAPGTAQYLHLIVSDIEAAQRELAGKGVATSGIFHDAAGGYNRFNPAQRASGPDPARRTYASFLTFNDPDGNGWILQEITNRFPGRMDPDATTFTSAADLAGAMRRAAMAHGEHEKRTGGVHDENWPDWYAAYMVAEQSGAPPPT
jgi:catechol 2,3-dioxygenase-like lactoylglutathione lyase family enzyme